MTGSDKQIKWATELRDSAVETIREFVDYAKTAGAPAAVVADWSSRIDKLTACDIAGAVIDQFDGFSRTGDIQKDAVSLNAKYNAGTNRYGYKFN